MKPTKPATKPDCLLTFDHIAWAYRGLTNDEWFDLMNTGTFDDSSASSLLQNCLFVSFKPSIGVNKTPLTSPW